MQIGVIKLGSRISYGGRDTSGGNGEVRSIIRILQEGGAHVHVLTKILKNDYLEPTISWNQIVDEYNLINKLKLDALLVINGNLNFFGGAEDREQILNYHIINNFKGPVYYVLCDPALQLKQIWPSVSKKSWGSNYKQLDIEITRKDIVYIAQPYNTHMLLDIVQKNNIEINTAYHFPFEQFPCLNEQLPMVPLDKLTADLSYGGTMRGNKREKKMIDFYWGYPNSIDVEMFGKIEHDNFTPKKIGSLRPPRFSGSVKYDDFLPRMNTCLSTVVIGDPLYEKLGDLNQRIYESIWSNVITFIDADFDKDKRAYGHESDLADFLYVSNRNDVINKLDLIKNNKSFREDVLMLQFKTVNFNKHKYSGTLINIIKENL